MAPDPGGPDIDDIPEPYANDTPLVEMFGPNARIKIIAALLGEREHDWNVSDIARSADVARSTVYEHLNDLQQWGIVVQTREVGGAPMYQINTENEIVKHVVEIQGLALERLLNEER